MNIRYKVFSVSVARIRPDPLPFSLAISTFGLVSYFVVFYVVVFVVVVVFGDVVFVGGVVFEYLVLFF